jgi:glucose/arabinose dehydrogenase
MHSSILAMSYKFFLPSLASLILCASGSAAAATFSDTRFSEQVLATDLEPSAMAIAPDGRIFICTKAGSLRVFKGGQLLAKPFVTLTVLTSSEQGLLGVAFHPGFPDSNWVYVFYTLANPNHNRVSRFRADGDTALRGRAGENIIFEIDNMTAGNHNGGGIHFGNDGKLYISAGNSASGANGLNMATTLGKILRVNPDGSIPADNPFLSQTTGKNQAIWTAGMRNTFTFAVDQVTGRIFGAEVGDSWEEVNELIGGSNYGYSRQEGYTVPTNTTGIVGTFRPALYAYDGGGCIIAASFYTPTGAGFTGTRNFPENLHRKFFFADYRNHYIKALDIANPTQVSEFATGAQSPVDIKFGADGVMYYLNRGASGGSLYRVAFAGGPTGSIGSPRSSPRAVPRGWRMQVAREGRLAWPVGVQALEIHGLDGRAVPFKPQRRGDEPWIYLPASIQDGIYFVRRL